MPRKQCQICDKEFTVIQSRVNTAKYCSTQCRDIGLKSPPNQACSECGTAFYVKQSQIDRYRRTLGVFCSNACAGASKAKAYAGSSNPNFKARNVDRDGYRIYSPQASFLNGLKRMKLHQAICCEALGIEQIPKGLHVHHRDCNILNNVPSNLVVLNASDHKWLHKQYGIATLWAYYHDKIKLDTLVEWADDPNRAKRLLPLTVLQQTKEQILLLETPNATSNQETDPDRTASLASYVGVSML